MVHAQLDFLFYLSKMENINIFVGGQIKFVIVRVEKITGKVSEIVVGRCREMDRAELE